MFGHVDLSMLNACLSGALQMAPPTFGIFGTLYIIASVKFPCTISTTNVKVVIAAMNSYLCFI